MAGCDIHSVYTGIAGSHVRSLNSHGIVAIRDKEVSAGDVDRVIDAARAVAIPADQKILHILPQEFIIDNQEGIHEPIGMSGVRLEARVHMVTGAESAAQNIVKCVERCGLTVEDVVLEQLASSFAVLTEDEKELGVCLVDIGGGTTDIAVFEDGTIRHTAVIAVAGNKVTDDIRKGLGVMRDQAEALKCRFGNAVVDLIDEDDEIRIPGIGGRPAKGISRSTLAQIIQPRIEEILEIAAIEIKRSGYARHLAAGAVLTGGGSLIPGTAVLGAEILGMETRVGLPTGLGGGLVEEVSDPKFSTAVGLVLYGLQPEVIGGNPFISDMGDRAAVPRPMVPAGPSLVTKIADRMKGWFDEL
ncbi:MAG TPA: cell division protein FtsA [Rhodothermales bacterium]|nr:cell division protein FtsA [Rhodothermales bacterium]